MSRPPSLRELDLATLRAARSIGHTETSERAVRAYSALGQHALVWLALGLGGAVLDPARARAWCRSTAVVAGAYLVNQAVKLAVRRPRPALTDLPPLVATPTQISFPSAHATSSLAAARAFGELAPAGALYPAAIAMAASRVWLGVHYPSDVLAGGVLGIALASVAR